MAKTVMRLIAVGVIAYGAWGARAADPDNPDWPCIQRKVLTLTAEQMWDGGEVDARPQGHDDPELAKLIAMLASRRVTLDAAAVAIAQFADAQPPEQRDQALRQLFAGLLSAVNRDRAIVMSGIERFHERQKARAAEIERQGAAIRQLRHRAAREDKARAELSAAEDRYNWDVRVFSERQQSLPLACEVPVMIEQRLFALGREIRTRMSD